MVQLIPESYVARLELPRIFGRLAPLHVDLGCGDGLFLCALARSAPEKNFLGIERLSGRVQKACRKAASLDNVRILLAETSYSVRYLLPEASVEAFYLLFPDPWPKRRHQRRRVLNPEFLQSIRRSLGPDGLLHIATDQLDYFQQMQRLALGDSHFETTAVGEDVNLPPTKFEHRFQEQGAPIYRIVLRKISPVI